MDVKERIIFYAKFKKLPIAKFEKQCGMSNGYIKNFKGNLSAIKLKGILTAFPDLNKDWLLTGEGEMLNAPLQSGHDNNQQHAHGTGITQTLTPSANEAALIENTTALIENTTALINEVTEMRKLIAEQTRNNQDQFNKFMALLNNLTHK
jgi:hypothetical protein